jgi:hypothetical protein
MSPDRLERMLSELAAPPATEARERTVAEARAEVAGQERAARPAGGRRRWVLAVALAVPVLAAALLTPPGREASGWVGELVGIGEVGGSPTLKERGFDSSGAIVIENGRAPDGTRYEWVAYGCKVDMTDEGQATKFKGVGFALEWPDAKGHEGGGVCAEHVERAPDHTFDSIGVHIVPSQFKGVAEPDLVMAGATGSRVHRVRVIYRATRGEAHDLPVDFARVEGELRRRVGDAAPGGTFVAFVPGAWAARDEVATRLDLRAQAGTGKLELGPYAREERRLHREARRACAPQHPDPRILYDRDAGRQDVERAFQPYNDCLEERTPPPPLEAIAYDAQGRELERWREPIPLPAPEISTPQGPLPWDERPVYEGAAGEPIVLAGGTAPEGARYEWYVHRTGKVPLPNGVCLTLWWPRYAQVGATGGCGTELPPDTAYGRRSPEDVMAKPYGFLDSAEPATEHFMLSGYARSHVERVRLVWDEGRSEADVELFRVTPEKAERMGASEPFGYWVSFVPPSARHAEFEVVAYGAGGGEIGRYEYRSEVTN